MFARHVVSEMLSRVLIECRGEHKELVSSLACSVKKDRVLSVAVRVMK